MRAPTYHQALGAGDNLPPLLSFTIPSVEKKPFIWSPSRINTLSDCPKKFFYTYIKGDGSSGTSQAAQLGKAVHKLLEEAVLAYKSKRSYSLEKRALEVASEFSLDENSRLELLKMLDNIKKFVSEKLPSLNHKDLHAEKLIHIPKVNLRGIIDLIVELPGKHVLIVDHKTSKQSLTKDSLPEDYQKQLLLYSYLTFLEKRDVEYFSLALYNVRKGEVVKWQVAQPKSFVLEKAKQVLTSAQNKLREFLGRNWWPTKVSWKCQFCQFQSSCPEFNSGDLQ